jgi:hypothetical protein
VPKHCRNPLRGNDNCNIKQQKRKTAKQQKKKQLWEDVGCEERGGHLQWVSMRVDMPKSVSLTVVLRLLMAAWIWSTTGPRLEVWEGGLLRALSVTPSACSSHTTCLTATARLSAT